MGKIVTIYLSNDEAGRLQEFCDENRCTQYSALKTAVKQLLSEPVKNHNEVPEEASEEPQEFIEELQEEVVISDDETEESLDQPDQTEPVTTDSVALLRRLMRARKVTKLTTSKTPKSNDSDLLIMNILKKAGGPLTTKELQIEVRKVKSFCPSSSVVGLNLLRIAGVIKGKRSEKEKGWIWWI